MLFSDKTQLGRLPNKKVQNMFRFYLYGEIKNKSQSSTENKIEKILGERALTRAEQTNGTNHSAVRRRK